MRKLRLGGFFLAMSFALLVGSVQAGTAGPQPSKVKQTARPLWALAMDGPRVAYLTNDRRVGVWNVVTGATSAIKGRYRTKGSGYGFGSSEVAIAGKRVALITRFATGNLYETRERLYTAPVGGAARQLGKPTHHSSYYGECDVPGSSGSDGDWIGGLVGSGKVLAVTTWRTNDSATSGERLRLITPTGLRTIATGPGAIVSQSADRGHIAVLRSTDVWPVYQGPAEQGTPIAGIYSAGGTLLREFSLDVPPLGPCGDTSTFIRIALSGNQLVVLRLDIPPHGSRTATVETLNWKTGESVHTWPLALTHVASTGTRIAVSGRVAVVSGPFKLQLLDLTTGKQVAIGASRPFRPATIGSRGLVYAVNPYKDGGRLVFVPMARLLAMLH